MRYLFGVLVLFTVLTLTECRNPGKTPELSPLMVEKVIQQMTELMVHDVTNPPLAARFFSYACLAGYEVISENDSSFASLHTSLNDYPFIKKPNTLTGYDLRLSAILAMLKTAEKMQPSGSRLLVFENYFLDSCRKMGFSEEVIDSSASYALLVSKKILAYAKADRYNRIGNYSRYKESAAPGDWHPTPPGYMIPVEPYFNTIRSMTLDSSSQFLPEPPIPFSIKRNSAFYKIMLLNYVKGEDRLSSEEKTIASFWDCNPFAVQNEGHMLIGLKKISPGAHWMGITGIACSQQNTGFSKTMQIHTVVAIGLLDAFICCWDDKYRTNRIRPETAIRKYIDPEWKPLLQTPPFPEYISGHSVISAASAVILTHYFGPDFHFTDSVETKFGIPPRKFQSFKQAAREAAISRFWGGIHFMDAIDNGVIQGIKVGNWVVIKMNQKPV